jgi:acetyltransferase-like isoleucine patch superfamily enzyme
MTPPRPAHSVLHDPRAVGRWRRIVLDLLPDRVVLRHKRRRFARCARLDESAFLSRDFSYEPHADGDIRYEIGAHSQMRGCTLLARGAGRIRIGECTSINAGARIESHAAISIGAHVQIAHGVTILDTNSHSLDLLSRRAELRLSFGLPAESPRETPATAPVVIEDDAWIGLHAIVLKGVTIGAGAIVGAGAVVTSDVAPGMCVAGNPARPLAQRPG